MTEEEYQERLKRLDEINQEQFVTILDLSRKLREMEKLLEAKRLPK